MPVEVSTFAEIEVAFRDRVDTMVWCNVATVDAAGRPRSRILHLIWDGSTGWAGTRRHSFKAKHLAGNPNVSLAYISDTLKPVYVDCTAEWADDLTEKQHVWDLFSSTAPPLGYDPTSVFRSVHAPDFGVLKFRPRRIKLGDGTGTGTTWIWKRLGSQ